MVGNAGATANGAEREYATEDPARGGPRPAPDGR